MPRINADAVASNTKRKREEDEKKKQGGQASTSHPIIPEPLAFQAVLALQNTDPEAPITISIIHPEGHPPRNRARTDARTFSAAPTNPQGSNVIFTGPESFDVDNPGTEYIAGKIATVLIKSLMGYSTSVGGKAVEEKEALMVEIGNLKKSNTDLKKAANDAEGSKKKAKEELGNAQTEVVEWYNPGARGVIEKNEESEEQA